MFDDTNGGDRRVRRTKQAIQSAFSQMLRSDEFDRIQVADILRKADVARSTFYRHFTSKDDLLCSVMEPILDPLARAGSEPVCPPHLIGIAEHIWDHRRLGPIFVGSTRTAVIRNLAKRQELTLQDRQLESQLPINYVASVIAHWQIASMQEWLTGRYRCDATAWAHALCRGTSGLAAALIESPEADH